MRKIVLSALGIIFTLCGCASFDSGILSESEKLTIIDMARYTITKMPKNKKFVSAAEASVINKKMPEVKVLYTGSRQGKMTISWALEDDKLNGKVVNFIYSGKFLTDSAMWQMGIVKYEKRKTKSKVNPLRKRANVKATDFDDLRNTKRN